MSISPFMAGVHGFLVRRQQAKDAQALREHDLDKIRTTAITNADIASNLIPKMSYIDSAGDTQYFTVPSNSDPDVNVRANWDVADAGKDLGTATDLSNTFMRVYEKYGNLKDLDPGARTALNMYGKQAMDLMNITRTKHTEAGNTRYVSNHPIFELDLGNPAGNHENVDLRDGNTNIVTAGDGPNQLKIAVQAGSNADWTKLMPDVDNYLNKIAPNHNGSNPRDPQHFEGFKKDLKSFYGLPVLYAAAKLDENFMFRFHVDRGSISPEAADRLAQYTYTLFPYDTNNEAQNTVARNNFVYKVIKSSASDMSHTMSDGITEGSMLSFKDWGSTYLGDKGLDGKRLKYSAGNEVGLTIQSLANDMIIWSRNGADPHRPLPAGGLGKFQGLFATILKKGGGADHAIEILKMIKSGFGVSITNDSQEKFIKRIESYSQDYITDVGEFQASYNLYMEILSYQMAAMLQGGTGGRTISDTDVENMKRALGDSLFVAGEFQSHRLDALSGILGTMQRAYEKYARATSIGDLKSAKIYEEYIFGTALRGRIEEGGLNLNREAIGIDLNPHTEYMEKELYNISINFLGNVFSAADQKHGNPNLPTNAAKIMADDPEAYKSWTPDEEGVVYAESGQPLFDGETWTSLHEKKVAASEDGDFSREAIIDEFIKDYKDKYGEPPYKTPKNNTGENK